MERCGKLEKGISERTGKTGSIFNSLKTKFFLNKKIPKL